ncbi:MAG: hypothetical protein JWQ40_2781 [Segetibacter sp.]|nr:hypothetical protein [Segetibacter sp.]
MLFDALTNTYLRHINPINLFPFSFLERFKNPVPIKNEKANTTTRLARYFDTYIFTGSTFFWFTRRRVLFRYAR